RMRQVASMDQKLRRLRQRIDIVNRHLQSSVHVRVCGLVEANVTIADLHKAEIVRVSGLTEKRGLRNATGHRPHHPCARPRHTSQKSTAVDTIGITIHRIMPPYGWTIRKCFYSRGNKNVAR